jgi:hypothetical protein
MAQGIKQGISDRLPKICGKELLKDGAAWIATKCSFPMLSLYVIGRDIL